MTYILLALAIILLTTGQLLQKLGAVKIGHHLKPIDFLRQVLMVPEFIGAVACLSLGTICWLFVLLHMEVSKAYPFLSLGYIIVLIYSSIILKEQVSASRWFGVILIACGTAIVAVS